MPGERMKRTVFQILFAAAAALMSGCVFMGEEYIAPATYDLEQSEKISQVQVSRIRVRNGSGADRRFLYRGRSNRMRFDEYNLWLLDPELLLGRALNGFFASRSESGVEMLCKIEAFEFDLVRKTARLKLSIEFARDGKTTFYSRSWSSSFDAERGSSAAEAMNKCVRAAMEDIEKQCGGKTVSATGDKK